MPARYLIHAVLLAAMSAIPARAEEAILLPMPTKAPQTLPVSATTESIPAAFQSCEAPERVCTPQRIRVIVPPPEVVFRYPSKQCGNSSHLGHKGAKCCPAADAGNLGGQMTFNMNYTAPGMSYQMAPMMMMGAGGYGYGAMPAGFSGFPAGSGFGMSGLGGVSASGSMGLEGQLRSLLGLPALAGASGAASSGLEAQLRSLLGLPAAAPNGDADAEARMRKLEAGVSARIDAEIARMRGAIDKELKPLMENEIIPALKEVAALKKAVKELEKKIDK